MKRIMAALLFALIPIPVLAKEKLRKFRHPNVPGAQRPQAGLLEVGEINPQLLKGVGEFVSRDGQTVGVAQVAGTWKQTILGLNGEVTYSAGALMEGLPQSLSKQGIENKLELSNALQAALQSLPTLRSARRIFVPSLEVGKNPSGEWIPYWRVEFLSPAEDQLRFLEISKEGKVLAEGALAWDGVDGRADVFPKGPKLSGVQEEVLRDLNGDGTMTGRLLHVISALDLNVWSPQLTFFFPQNDRRFDLGQAYFTIDQGYRWLKDHLGVELNHPIEVRLHVGQAGVSNAAFYHENTIYLGTGDGVVYRDMIRDPSILIHESIHALIDAYVGLPSEGEGGGYNEGFADLFTALILENPRMAEASYLQGPYRRTLENNLLAYRDFAPGVYQNGSIVAATFWDMKQVLGTELTAKLAFRTLVRLGKGAGFNDFGSALASASEQLLSEDQKQKVFRLAVNRGWRLP